jgi:WD40 repeat protein
VLLSAASDNTIRRWDLASAAPIGEPIAGPAEINAMSVIRLAGRPVVLVKGVDTIRAWDVADGTPVGAPIAGSRSILSPLTTVEVSGTTAVLTEGYLETGVVDLHTGAALDGYLTESVSLVATAVVVAGRPLLVEPGDGDDDKLIRLRDLRDGRPVGSPLAGHEDGIRSLQTVTVDGSPFLISTSYDNSIRIWDLTARSQG